jgi:hypothetical protein
MRTVLWAGGEKKEKESLSAKLCEKSPLKPRFGFYVASRFQWLVGNPRAWMSSLIFHFCELNHWFEISLLRHAN